MKRYLRLLIALILTEFLAACASQVPPTGGAKDEAAPEIEASTPTFKGTNFRGQQIQINFDEYITLENLKQQLIITPVPPGDYTYRPIRRGVVLSFDQPFLPNTTYTLNFRNSVRDITERNTATNLKLVFSTGPQLDSLTLSGRVKDALTNQPVEDALVGLYQANDTASILNKPPIYFSRTSKNGDYQLDNLKAGQYRIYALKENDNNLRLDKNGEQVAFLPAAITVDSSRQDLNLQLAKDDQKGPAISSVRSISKSVAEVTFSEGLAAFTVKFATNNDSLAYWPGSASAIRFYNNSNRNDSIPLQVIVTDSVGNESQHSLKISFAENSRSQARERQRREESKTTNWEISPSPGKGESIGQPAVFRLNFSLPVKVALENQIELLADTVRPLPSTDRQLRWNRYRTELTLTQTHKAQRIRLAIPAATFISIAGDSSRAIKNDYDLKNAEEFGSIRGRISGIPTEAALLVQLLDEQFKLIKEEKNLPSYQFDYLLEGNYYVRVIVDQNRNGQWDGGDIRRNKQPEPIYWYNNGGTLRLKANWELPDVNIDLN